MSKFNARVYAFRQPAEMEAELSRIGAEWPGIVRMSRKAVHFVVKVHGVRSPAAIILKEEMLAKGGDAAIHRDCITNRIERSDVLLMGTEKVFNQVLPELHEQPFSLGRLADEISSAISNYKQDAPLTPADEELPGRLLQLYTAVCERTLVMGVLNVTPDSFSDGGLYSDIDAAVAHAGHMVEDGADIIDVGGESSRPGALPVSAQDELSRVIPVIERLSGSIEIPISIDTYKPEVARAALDAGADIINDITGLENPDMRCLAAERRAPSVIMHMKGTPEAMQSNPEYEDVVSELLGFFRERIGLLVEAGLPQEYLIIDPGIGFGKTAEHNIEIIRKLGDFKSLGLPILIGTSRKAFIGKVLEGLPTTDRVHGTSATVAVSIANGANIIRVHDVKEMVQVARMTDAISRHAMQRIAKA